MDTNNPKGVSNTLKTIASFILEIKKALNNPGQTDFGDNDAMHKSGRKIDENKHINISQSKNVVLSEYIEVGGNFQVGDNITVDVNSLVQLVEKKFQEDEEKRNREALWKELSQMEQNKRNAAGNQTIMKDLIRRYRRLLPGTFAKRQKVYQWIRKNDPDLAVELLKMSFVFLPEDQYFEDRHWLAFNLGLLGTPEAKTFLERVLSTEPILYVRQGIEDALTTIKKNPI